MNKDNNKDYKMISLYNYLKIVDEVETEKRIQKSLKEFDNIIKELDNNK